MKLITIYNIKLNKGKSIVYLKTLELLVVALAVPIQHMRSVLLSSFSRLGNLSGLIPPLGSQYPSPPRAREHH